MMENNNLNSTNYEDEVDLFELGCTLFKYKKTIAFITVCFVLLTAILSLFVIKPTYKTNINISMNMPEIMNTKYGEFTMPMKNNLEYINLFKDHTVMQKIADDMGYEDLTLKDVESKFKLPTTESNILDISVKAHSPEEAVKLANTAYEDYMIYLDLILKARALATFESSFSFNIEKNNNQIKNLQDSLLADKKMLEEVTSQINGTITSSNKYGSLDYVALGEALGYAGISTSVLEKQQEINQLTEDNAMYTKYLEEIESMKTKIQSYYETGDKTNLESENFDFVSQNVQLLSKPRIPNKKTSPKIVLNLGIGLILGVMSGIFFALSKEFYLKAKENKR